MPLPIYQVDAFAARLFRGNPAAIMPLESWLGDDAMQAIAMENNLSETAFIVAEGNAYGLRWFTPEVEVDLCGHATLAAAHVLFEHLDYRGDEILFTTRSGELRVSRGAQGLTLDFPAHTLEPVDVDVAICDALGLVASEAWAPVGDGGPLLCVYEFESDVTCLEPDFAALKEASDRPVVATAPGEECDVASRFFAPQVGINEDPVTGSAHCAIVPYWSRRLGTDRLRCRQVSQRVGELDCKFRTDRVYMTGKGVTFMQGEVFLD